ncbi:MAG TPA: site-2 protease family protein, partial [Arthrobacter sp.]|nr:site-2 protease family protein [Arthrobacter sp.]
MTDTDTRSGRDPQKQGRKEGIPLGRIAGIPVILAYSWFVIAAFTVIVYGPVLQANDPELGIGAYVVAFAYAVLLLISVLVHELAHALTAKIYHWPSEKIVLNLWGGHTQFESFTASPGRSVVVALAGPAANLVLAAGGWLVLTGGELTGVAGILANIFVWANLLIGIFNVLPGLPLDGGRLVESA